MSGSIPVWARVGAKVVVASVRPLPFGGAVPFSLREIVTISAVDGYCVALLEYPAGQVTSYFIDRFRPLVTDEQREADLAQFRKLLTIREPEAA